MKSLQEFINEAQSPKYTVNTINFDIVKYILSEKQKIGYKYLKKQYPDSEILHVRGKKLKQADIKNLSTDAQASIQNYLNDKTIKDNEIGLLVVLDNGDYKFLDTSEIERKTDIEYYEYSNHENGKETTQKIKVNLNGELIE